MIGALDGLDGRATLCQFVPSPVLCIVDISESLCDPYHQKLGLVQPPT